ncbi:hypothetical protein [Demequina gelatinilytica]|uniref:hypothetical protein n=1 Tax=Demequina gelatinilytica TaxID=1638980 RepID=UPI000785F263|nr:hypothetical protein [Demequina gelatinilytica]
MAGEQLRFYAADRGGRTAIVETATGRIVAWVERLPDGMLRARRTGWMGEPVETVPQCIWAVGEAVPSRSATVQSLC